MNNVKTFVLMAGLMALFLLPASCSAARRAC